MEGLPAIVTVALAIGVQRMIKRKSIVRKLPAVEILGCATVICSDKTGTLTQNQMTVREIATVSNSLTVTGEGYDPKGDILEQGVKVDYQKHEDLVQLLKISVLCNNSRLQKGNIDIDGLMRVDKKSGGWGINGDPTEGALIVLGAKAGIWRETVERKAKRIYEIPFDSDRKKMSTIYENYNGDKVAYVKGAPEVILQSCSHVLIKGKIEPLTEALKERFLNENIRLATKALRVLGLAYKNLSAMDDHSDEKKVETGLVFAGLVGMIDPPRVSAIKAIAACKLAGIKPVMITGDYKVTAEAVARELKIANSPETLVAAIEEGRGIYNNYCSNPPLYN